MWDLVGNPEDRFSQNEAHIGLISLRIRAATAYCLLKGLSVVRSRLSSYYFDATAVRSLHLMNVLLISLSRFLRKPVLVEMQNGTDEACNLGINSDVNISVSLKF